jgi:hypothetical protein
MVLACDPVENTRRRACHDRQTHLTVIGERKKKPRWATATHHVINMDA